MGISGAGQEGELTGNGVRAAVLLKVALALGHGHRAGLGLVGAQGVRLLHQTVLVLRMILHVGLRDTTGSP